MALVRKEEYKAPLKLFSSLLLFQLTFRKINVAICNN